MDFKAILCSALAKASELSEEQIGNMLETPPNPEIGDFALPCFKLAKTLRKAPPALAAEL
ncbi:MAG: arginine--tRNA ligase, partial [Clostridia bacterium]|nr:arginine--tRNA ligase [Clostridia bacterium]